MVQHYNYLIDMLKEIDNGSETIPSDEDYKLALHEIYFNKDYNKLGGLAHLLANIYFKKGKFKDYSEAFEETVADLYNCYKQIDEQYFNKKEADNIQRFYIDSMKKSIINN